MPRYYGTFNLNDKQGRYIMNYDGDYWITYYKVESQCNIIFDGNKLCHDILHKQDSSSITETPVDLKPFIDKEVRITGSFTVINGSIINDKKYCIKKNFFQQTCTQSTGPGYWHASPIKIGTIKLDKK